MQDRQGTSGYTRTCWRNSDAAQGILETHPLHKDTPQSVGRRLHSSTVGEPYVRYRPLLSAWRTRCGRANPNLRTDLGESDHAQAHNKDQHDQTKWWNPIVGTHTWYNQRKFRSSNFRLYWKLPVGLAASMFDRRNALAGRNCPKCCVFP